MGFLTGGSKSKSSSGNSAYPWAMETFGESSGNAYGGSTNALGNILGLNGSSGHSAAMDDYWKSSGGDFLLNQGLDDLTSRYSAMGLRKSGSAMKGMEQYRQGLASTKLDNYLGHLGQLGQLGLGGGNLVTQAGQWSKGDSSQKEGLGSLIGSALSAAAMFSDRRLKTKIELIRRGADGLGWYRYAYKWAVNQMTEGAMADEVKQLRPWAHVPNFRGEYDGVDYSKLGAV